MPPSAAALNLRQASRVQGRLICRYHAYIVKRMEHDTPAQRLATLHRAGIRPPYPRYQPKTPIIRIPNLKERYKHFTLKDYINHIDSEETVTINGRIRRVRDASKFLIFYDIEEDGVTTQVVANWRMTLKPGVNDAEYETEGKAKFQFRHMALKIGDIVSITGHPGRTSAGEFSIFANELFTLLTPCLKPIPEALTNEQRQHHRHLDMLVNPESSARTLRLRSKVMQTLRRFLLDRDFVEVQTPILSHTAGGAIAKPFVTEATSSLRGRKLNLRIAPELWLKRLVIGGLDRVFEIGPQFRNEHIDNTHNPEFTTCEFYQAYATLDELVELTESLLHAIDVDLRSYKGVQFTPFENMPFPALDVSEPFQHIEFVPKLEELLGAPLPDLDSRPVKDVTADLSGLCSKHKIPLPSRPTPAALLDKLGAHFLEPLCERPTFIKYHPEALSPLAKTELRDGRRVARRMEVFVNGKEIVNAYEEENDPTEQRKKFEAQSKHAQVDEAYLQAMEYGLPPTAGWGIGIDRLMMTLVNTERISDVIVSGLRGAVNQGGEVMHGMKPRKTETETQKDKNEKEKEEREKKQKKGKKDDKEKKEREERRRKGRKDAEERKKAQAELASNVAPASAQEPTPASAPQKPASVQEPTLVSAPQKPASVQETTPAQEPTQPVKRQRRIDYSMFFR